MKRVMSAAVAAIAVAAGAWAAGPGPAAADRKPHVFEKFLSAERATDRVISQLVARDDSGTATATDLAELGVLLINRGFPAWGVEYLQRAVDSDRTNVEAMYRLGLAFQRQGEQRRAIRWYKRVLKQRPGFAYARFLVAMAEEQQGHRRSAIHDYAKAYHHAPELADPRFNPLVNDSRLQTEVHLALYQRELGAATFKMTAIDPARIQEMGAIKAGGTMPAPPTATTATTPDEAAPGAPPDARPQPVPAAAPAAARPASAAARRQGSSTTQGTPRDPVLPGASGTTVTPAEPDSGVHMTPVTTAPLPPMVNVSGEAIRH